MKVARFNETFPQAELRRLEQVERDAAHRAAETPKLSVDVRQNIWHLNGLLRHPNTPSSASSACNLHGVSERYRNH
ncbi:hypothetical protein TNCV_657181 [Trichonephila clavipes]|nr:hypothetical protein TNCV_657181 [Trichonephila clavipes]